LTIDGSEFNQSELDRSTFLQKVLAYGHWNLFMPEDMRIIPREDFLASLGTESAPGQFLADLLRDTDEDEVKIMILNDSALVSPVQSLFFSELSVFERYLQEKDLPLLTFEDELRTFIIGDLPGTLTDLNPSRYWKYWVTSLTAATPNI
jgi:hypothetical protein